MSALRTGLALAAALALLCGLSGCTSTTVSGSNASRTPDDYYDRAGIHVNTWPETFGGGDYGGRYGRPGNYRRY